MQTLLSPLQSPNPVLVSRDRLLLMYSLGNNHGAGNARQLDYPKPAAVPAGLPYYDPSYHQPPPANQYAYAPAIKPNAPAQHIPPQPPVQPLQPPPLLYLHSDVNAKFSAQDVQILRQLLMAGEKHKWKHITKEINNMSSANNCSASPYGKQHPKNVSPTFVIKQYQNMLGIPSNNVYFGQLGSSLPYVVAENGWDDIAGAEQGRPFTTDGDRM